MKITYPHMGTLSMAVKGIFESLGLEVIPPAPITKQTIDRGVLHSPEYACLPLKINLGNFMEALDAGADTIIMAGGTGPCRFGYYAQVQREILQDLGYKFKMVVLEPPQGNKDDLISSLQDLLGDVPWRRLLSALYFAWYKVKALDKMYAMLLWARPREIEKRKAEAVYNNLAKKIEAAVSTREVAVLCENGKRKFEELAVAGQKMILKVGLVGEIYTILEPAANMDVEKVLGEMGVEVERSIYLSDWIKEHLLLSPLYHFIGSRAKKAAHPYLRHFVGGHGLETVGNTVLYGKRRFDGVVHVMPFTCTPEIVAQGILPTVSKEQNIPVLSFSLDEQTGRAGFVTRLEAFMDLLSQKKYQEHYYGKAQSALR